jgi:Xaa-Pro aminopeptidase
MFQSFDDRSGTRPGTARLAALRGALSAEGLAGFIVPHSDEHRSEYLPPSAMRLAWLTGFSGSAGMAIVLRDEAALFVDGRYTLQAAAEVDTAAFSIAHLVENPPHKWLAARLRPGDRIGYDPWLLTAAEAARFNDACAAANAHLVPLSANLIDTLWTDRPAPPLGAVRLHPLACAGESSSVKLDRLRALLAESKADAAVLTLADSIAWTFNIRGADIPHNPVVLSNAILRREGRPSLFIDGRKLANAVRAELDAVADIFEPADFIAALARLRNMRVLVDPQTAPAAIRRIVEEAGATVVEGADPVLVPKSRKNAVELEGARRAHIRDGAAMVRFLVWLDREAPAGAVDEIAAAEALERFRADTAERDGTPLEDISFDTISGAGPNGAIVHYRVTRSSNRRLEPGFLYLVDSGGQYRDGTTDITRTVAIGEPSAEMRDRFTRVLKGHIAMATARFPAGTTGAHLDAFARRALWEAGLDYDHGTGHGVGSFLSVHEGPARIARTGHAPLEPGMILSNEPGFYKPHAWGIRIENLVVVTEPKPVAGGDRAMLAFETLTLCPIDRRLIDATMLGPDERAWLDAYHARLAPALGHLLDQNERRWLEEAAAPVAG